MARTRSRRIAIVGGGLAGLSLGGALRTAARELPVTLFEAGDYPRHKVCGEFIAGLPSRTIEGLGLTAALAEALPLSEVAWFREGEPFRRDALPRPAWGISRHALDAELAARFVALGGDLRTRHRVARGEAMGWDGAVWCVGRQRERSEWVGLKAHVKDLELAADLEMHLGREAYAGVSRLGGGWSNVCGLLRRERLEGCPSGEPPIVFAFRSAGLEALAERMERGAMASASQQAVAGLGFGKAEADSGERFVRIGDAYALIPPFTGDGMAMAFEAAEQAVDPLVRYGRGEWSWGRARFEVQERLDTLFTERLRTSRVLHPFLRNSWGQTAFRAASWAGLLPFRGVFDLLHARG